MSLGRKLARHHRRRDGPAGAEPRVRVRLRRFSDQSVLRTHHQPDRHQHHARRQPESDQRPDGAVLDRPCGLHGRRRIHRHLSDGVSRQADRGACRQHAARSARRLDCDDSEPAGRRGCGGARGTAGRHSVAAAQRRLPRDCHARLQRDHPRHHPQHSGRWRRDRIHRRAFRSPISSGSSRWRC